MALLEIRNVTRRYGALAAVENVSFSVEAGEFFTLLGPSGCGKTTLLRMIAGFEAPDAGRILLDGPDLAHRFINFMLDGRNSAELTNLIGSGNPNLDAMPYIKPEIASNTAIFPDRERLAKLEMLKDLDRNKRRVLSSTDFPLGEGIKKWRSCK